MEDGAPHPPVFFLDQVSSWERRTWEPQPMRIEWVGRAAPVRKTSHPWKGGNRTEDFLGRSLSEE